MSNEKFNLSWNDYNNWTNNIFKELVNDNEFSDVTLVCKDDKQIKAHKVILSACSDFFKKIFVKNPHQHPLIYLKGISFRELSSILEFIYSGQTEVDQAYVESFMISANELRVKGLIQEVKEGETNFDLKKEDIEELSFHKEESKKNEGEYFNHPVILP